MARRGSATIQDELYSTPDEPARADLDDARLLDLDAEKESPFLRAQKRVPARRSPLPKKTAARLLWALLAIAIAAIFAISAAAMYHYGQHSWRFRLNSSDDLEMVGLGNVTRYPYLFAELLRRGYSDDDVLKVAGRNHLRAMRQMEKVASELRGHEAPLITEGIKPS